MAGRADSDVLGIAQQARILNESHDHNITAQQREARDRDGERQTLLLVRSPGNGRLAIPLARSRGWKSSQPIRSSKAGEVDVIQYRGQIPPLIRLKDILGERRTADRLAHAESDVPASNLLEVIVFGDGARRVGLAVDEIIDIVQDVFEIKGRSRTSNGVAGTLVIQNRVTELFDVQGFLHQAEPLLALAEEA